MRLKRRSRSRRASSSSSSSSRGGWQRGAEGGGQQQVLGAKSGKVCVCLQTAEFAPSSVNAASCRLGVLHEKQNACPPSPLRALWRAFFGGLKGGKKGGFTSDSVGGP